MNLPTRETQDPRHPFAAGLLAGVLLGAALAVLLIVLLSPYRYHTFRFGTIEQPVREHRITGTTESFTLHGWQPAERIHEQAPGPSAPAPTPRPPAARAAP